MKTSKHAVPGASYGFTLIELSVVLAIISAIVGMAITSGYSVIASARLAATNKKMATIDQALQAYRIANDRIPCPSDLLQTSGSVTYGTEYSACATTSLGTNGMFTTNNVGGTAFEVAEGGVPTVTLGLPNDFMYDGWGSRIRYAVDVNMTYAGAFSGTQLGAVCGGITIFAPGATYPTNSSNGIYLSNNSAGYAGAIYALISHGPNQHGGVTGNGVVYSANSNNADELTNCHCTNTGAYGTYTATYVGGAPYTYKTYSLADSSYNFDDIVTFRERWQMAVPWDQQGVTCPAIYVADGGNKRVQKLDMNGNYLTQYSYANATNPNSVMTDNNGNIWVVDYGYNTVFKLSSSGSVILGIGCGYQSITAGCSGGTGSPNYYGGSGSGTGEFNSPSSIAMDSNGNIWVTDENNNRIQEFTSSGTYIMSIPSSGTSSGAATGMFKGVHGIAIDTNNNIWVADAGNNRIQEFSNNGAFVQAIGGGSQYNCTAAAPPACLTTPSATGAMSGPKGISIDSVGNIWVADSGYNRIVKFANTGIFVTAITTNGTSVFSNPRSVSFDMYGYMWISDTSHSQIDKCTIAGACSFWGSSGSGNRQFSGADSIFAVAR